MARPLRLEYPGALYHVMTRGNDKQPVFRNIYDRINFLDILCGVIERYNWHCHSYCLMENHYHLLIETIDPTLSKGMRQLNGVYTQRFNRHHDRVGHIFQGRYKSILVEKNAYLLELCRYIVLNPVRAGLVERPGKWRWSSYRALTGAIRKPPFLTTDWVLVQFDEIRDIAQQKYLAFVANGTGDPAKFPDNITGQLIFGGKEFIADIQEKLKIYQDVSEITRDQRMPGRPSLSALLPIHEMKSKNIRDQMIALAHITYGYTLGEIALELGIHYSTAGRAIKIAKCKNARLDPKRKMTECKT